MWGIAALLHGQYSESQRQRLACAGARSHRPTEGSAIASRIWDLLKCDEHVRQELVAGEAERLQMPSTLVRVEFASYQWSRRLNLGRVWSRAVYTDQTIAVGAPICTPTSNVFRAATHVWS